MQNFQPSPARSPLPTPRSPLDSWLALALALGCGALYVATGVRGPFDGDSGEFQYMPRILGLPHPTGYPLYLLLGWAWSWLPIGVLALRMNLFSALWAAATAALLFCIGRGQGWGRVASAGGALALALAPALWRYAGVAAVYTLHTALLAAALALWLRWTAARARGEAGERWLWLAALATGLALTNHPTAAFLVPAALLFALGFGWPRQGGANLSARTWLVAAALFALPGLLYGYVPLRLWAIGPGEARFGLQESIARGLVAPFLQWNWPDVGRYITGRSLLGSYRVEWATLPTALPPLLRAQVGLPLVGLGALGAAAWAWRQPRSFVALAVLFLPAAAYAIAYDAEFAGRGQIAHLEGHLLPALLVWALWAGRGLEAVARAVQRLPRGRGLASLTAGAALVAALVVQRGDRAIPTAADRAQSEAIHRYWTEVLAYPLDEGAALTGHWGDLTAFWYFQHGEGRRRDLWAIFPPNVAQMDAWLAGSGRPLFLAGPLLDWSPDLAGRYTLVPWGILVRVAPPGSEVAFPPLTPSSAQFGGQLQLEGYQTVTPTAGRRQLWLAWRTLAPTPRDLSVSLRLHAPDGTQLLQQDGRLASLWYPDGTLPAAQPLLSVFDLEVPPDLPPGTIARIVVYDPVTLHPLLTAEGQDVFELGPFEP